MRLFAALIALCCSPAFAGEGATVHIEAGPLLRFYPVEGEDRSVNVPAFDLDVDPVSNGEFREFVMSSPGWSRDRIARIFADESYLIHWPTPTDTSGIDEQPVTRVSWFAARAYCEAKGKRLPTEVEWERAGQASATRKDASSDPSRTAKLLSWYSRPATLPIGDVGSGTANVWGVRDMHGMVWEWVEDFNSSFAASDSRAADDGAVLRFCGSGSVSAADSSDYATFMRLAFRSSLQGAYTTRTLGFRCATSPRSH
ncbi:MAG: sulfatase modifying factor 1 [Kiritimatiellia bacterium]